MPKFKVTLDILIPATYEVEITANSVKEAKESALDAFRNSSDISKLGRLKALKLDEEGFYKHGRTVKEDLYYDYEAPLRSTGISCEELPDTKDKDQQEIESLHFSSGKFGTNQSFQD